MIMNMSIAQAFKLRSKVAKLSSEIRNKVSHYDRKFYVLPEDVEVENRHYKTKTYDGDIQLLLDLSDFLKSVNLTIDRANVGGRDLLDKIASCRVKVEILSSIIEQREESKTYTIDVNEVTGAKKRVDLVPLGQKDWNEERLRWQLELNKLEDKLGEFNGMTKVNIEIPENLALLVAAA